MKIPVTVGTVTSVKMNCADFQGIQEIASLYEGPLKRKNILISGISKHALNEPCAAGIEYAHHARRASPSARRELVVVYDLGGGAVSANLLYGFGHVNLQI